MKRVALVLLTWMLAGVGAVLGSFLGSGGGQLWLFIGAVFGGALGSASAAFLASRLRLIAPQQVARTAAGGLLGFGVAVPLAMSNFSTPVVPALSAALAGLGALLGTLLFKGPRTGRMVTEAKMNRYTQFAVLGLLLLLPALVLTSGGLLGLEPPRVLTHPALVMGGLFLALALNALSVLRVRFRRDDGDLVAAISVRLRGAVLNLTALTICCLLLATIAGYLFVENFQPR